MILWVSLLDNKQATIWHRDPGVSLQDRERNPTRTRAAILDAAEQLFAEKGYDSTSLNEVGAQAGVSRGTPGYFFGSKQALYQAVLERAFAEVRQAVRTGRERALASSQPAEVILTGAVSDYFDFLAARPHFMRLIEREALSAGPLPDRAGHLSAGQEALAAISVELGLDPSPSGEVAQLLLSIISLCWFPLIHARTVAAAVGVGLDKDEEIERRRQHVISLVMHGIRGLIPTPLTEHSSHD
jgi:AcrR family transcriptional regulator